MSPLCVDLYAGLGGWAEGFLAEGYRVIGFDIERHRYWVPEMEYIADGSKHTKPVANRGWTQGCAIALGMEGEHQKPRTRLLQYPGQLVLQDVFTLHGSQFRDAAVIVASPPCQNYSYRAMPWKQSKALTPAEVALPEPSWWALPEYVPVAKRKADSGPCMTLQDMAEWAVWKSKYPKPAPSNELFDACFRIQREACEAAGHQIPLIVENVKGAQPWVGRAKWHYGSFYLWGDVPALMPSAQALKRNPDGTNHGQGSWFAIADSKNRGSGHKVPGFNFHAFEKTGKPGGSFQSAAVNGVKVASESGRRTDIGKGARFTSRYCGIEGVKQPGLPGAEWFDKGAASRGGNPRKAASAQIAKIPFELAQYIARLFKPEQHPSYPQHPPALQPAHAP